MAAPVDPSDLKLVSKIRTALRFPKPGPFYTGLTLLRIVASLRELGAGRYVARKRWLRYAEPCCYQITRARLEWEGKTPVNATVYGVRTWRGLTEPTEVSVGNILTPEWLLIRRNEENRYLADFQEQPTPIIPDFIDLPPLVREMAEQRHLRETGVALGATPKMRTVIQQAGVQNRAWMHSELSEYLKMKGLEMPEETDESYRFDFLKMEKLPATGSKSNSL